jgi:hypothetical protein
MRRSASGEALYLARKFCNQIVTIEVFAHATVKLIGAVALDLIYELIVYRVEPKTGWVTVNCVFTTLAGGSCMPLSCDLSTAAKIFRDDKALTVFNSQ